MDALEKLKQNASVFGLTSDQLQSNFDRLQRQNKNTAKTATDVGASTTPELYSNNTKVYDTAKNSINASTFNIENYLNTLTSDNVTQQDLLKGQAGMTRQVLDAIKGLGTKGEITQEAYKDEDISGKRQLVQDYTNQLEAEKRALDLAIRDLPKDGTVSKRFRQGQIDAITTASLRKQADIAILANAAIGNLEVAQQNVQDRIALEYGPIEDKYNTLLMTIDAVSGLESGVKTQLKEQAQAEKELANSNQQRQQALYELAIDAQKAENPTLAQQFIRQANQITPDLDEATASQIFNSAQQQAISGGVYSSVGGGLTEREEDYRDDLAFLYEAGKEDAEIIKILSLKYPEYADRVKDDLNIGLGFNADSVANLPGEVIVDDFSVGLGDLTAENYGAGTRKVAGAILGVPGAIGRGVQSTILGVPGFFRGLFNK